MNEIARLCRITPPDFAVELNVLPVHVEHLGTVERIQQAKAELVEGMKIGGTAILNADDFRVMEMQALSKGKTVTYGIEHPADVSAANINYVRFGETHFVLNTPDGQAKVEMMLSGNHSVLNALAAAAVGFCFGMKAGEIAAALQTVAPPAQRGEVLHFAAGFTVINDSYNSNPAALLSMVNTLIENGQSAKRKIVVAGEMLELGENEAEIHQEIGERLGTSGIDVLYGVRNLAKNLIEGARNRGLNNVAFFSDSSEAGDFLANEIQPGDLVLVKGSRGVKTERVVEMLLEKFELEK
jgi:UDP-N-acetylmuramoyl-tripeptide--D-alanyl-D-alanine ligase